MRFEFATAGRILFGPGSHEEFGSIAGEFGKRALIVHGSNAARALDVHCVPFGNVGVLVEGPERPVGEPTNGA